MGRLSSITHTPHTARALGPMSDTSIFGQIDRICAQIVTALQHSQLQIYATIALVTILSALLFPPKNDPDQI
jgi:hypothetical protein